MSRGLSLLFVCTVLLGGCSSREPVAPLPPLAAAAAAEQLLNAPDYRLLAGDVLRVKFLYHPELDVKVPVREDGRIDIQGVGEVQAEGKTAEELAREIERVAAEILREPKVTVIVAELGPHKIYVGGEVRSPGFVIYREGMTPLQAIFDRGGFTDFSQTDRVLRQSRTKDGVKATRIDLSKTLKKGAPELTTLAVGDTIYVPRNAIGKANAFVRYWIRGLMPIYPRAGIGLGASLDN